MSHFEKSTHERRAVSIEKCPGFRGVTILCFRAVTVAFEKSERDERVEEVRVGPRMKFERVAQFTPCLCCWAKLGEQPKLHRRKQHLRWPERHADFHYSCGG